MGLVPWAVPLDAARVTGDLADLSNLSAQGTVEVADLALGNVVADTFIAEFRYGEGLAELTGGRFKVRRQPVPAHRAGEPGRRRAGIRCPTQHHFREL